MSQRLSEFLVFATRPSGGGSCVLEPMRRPCEPRTFSQLEIPHVQLDERRTRLRQHTQMRLPVGGPGSSHPRDAQRDVTCSERG